MKRILYTLIIVIFLFMMGFMMTVSIDVGEESESCETGQILRVIDGVWNCTDLYRQDPDLLAWWSFGLRNFTHDETGFHNGTSRNVIRKDMGHSGKSAYFSDSSYINISPTNRLNTKNNFTYSAWLRTNGKGAGVTGAILYSSADPITYSGWAIMINSGKFGLFTNGAGWVFADSIMADRTWRHIVAVMDDETVYFYLDGEADGSGASSFAGDYTGTRVIGRLASPSYYSGHMDDIMIFNRSLSASEVKELYESGNIRNNTEMQKVSFWDTIYATGSAFLSIWSQNASFGRARIGRLIVDEDSYFYGNVTGVDIIDADTISQGGTQVMLYNGIANPQRMITGNNMINGVSSGDINVTDVYYDSLHAKSPHHFFPNPETGRTEWCIKDNDGTWNLIYMNAGEFVIQRENRICFDKEQNSLCRKINATWDSNIKDCVDENLTVVLR